MSIKLVDSFNMTNSKVKRIPLSPVEGINKLMFPSKAPEGKTVYEYRELDFSLLYLAVFTRTDISFAVASLERFVLDEQEVHGNALK